MSVVRTSGPLASAIRKARRKLIPLLFLMGLVCLIDRASIGFASLTMNKDIGLSSADYGLGSGLFFIGYFILEVPSNLILNRVGARKWIARIGISWGIVMILTMFIWNDWSFYGARVLLGLAEAGLFPGFYLLVSQWIPVKYRALTLATIGTYNAVSGIVGGPIAAGVFAASNALHIVGWRALFGVVGVPAIIMAVVILFLLPDSPKSAKWLTPAERVALDAALSQELVANHAVHETRPFAGLGRALRHPNVWSITGVFFFSAIANYGITLFLPQIVGQFSATSPAVTSLLSAIPYVVGLFAMVLVGRSSDRSHDRRWHYTIACLVGAGGLVATGALISQPVLAMVALCVAVAGLMPQTPLFMSRATGFLTGAAAAAGFAVINCLGSLGGFVGPYIFGWLHDATNSLYGGLTFLAVAMLISAALTIGFRTPAEKTGYWEKDEVPADAFEAATASSAVTVPVTSE